MTIDCINNAENVRNCEYYTDGEEVGSKKCIKCNEGNTLKNDMCHYC